MYYFLKQKLTTPGKYKTEMIVFKNTLHNAIVKKGFYYLYSKINLNFNPFLQLCLSENK